MNGPAGTATTAGPATEPRPVDADRRGVLVRRLMLLAPGVIGAVALLLVTRLGPYTSPDSAFYVGMARGILDGDGITAPSGYLPLSNFPPLFPFALAAIGWLGPDPHEASAWMNPMLLAATVGTATVVIQRLTGSMVLAVTAGLLLVGARDLLAYHAAALSEPLFTFLAFAGLVVLAVYFERHRPAALVVSAGLLGGACLTRYVGVAAVGAGALALVWFGARRRWHGGLDVLILAGIALTPMLVWLAWANGTGPAGEGREVSFHLFDRAYLERGALAVGSWLVPPSAPRSLRLLAACAVACGVAWGLVIAGRRRRHRGSRTAPRPLDTLPWLLGAFTLLYLALLVVDRLLLDATGRLDSRFMGPVHLAAVVLAASVAKRAFLELGSSSARRAGMAGGAVVVALQVGYGFSWVAEGLHTDTISRRGYAAEPWEHSTVLRTIRSTDPTVAVVTNDPYAVHLLSPGRQVTPLPRKTDYHTGKPNRSYRRDLDRSMEQVRAGALLAYFDASNSRFRALPTLPELRAQDDVEIVLRDRVGTLYRPAEP